MTDLNKTINDYIIIDLISEEITTEIYKAYDKNTGEVVVIKYPKAGCSQIAHELEFIRHLSHNHILSMKESFDTPNGPALVLPFARGGDLFHWIYDHHMSEEEVKQLIFNLLHTLVYLHRQNLWHRDIKPENILIMNDSFSSDSVMLSDFGFCRQFKEGICDDEFCGSPHYAAPELFKGTFYTEKVDIWALGITMYACLTSSMPFDTNDYESMVQDILNGLPDLFNTDALDHVSDSCKDLLDWMLTSDPEKRASAEDALEHDWFNELREMKESEQKSEFGQIAQSEQETNCAYRYL